MIKDEKKYDRECTFECDDEALLETVKEKIATPERYRNVSRPKLLTECTACN